LLVLGIARPKWLRTPQFWYTTATLDGAAVYLNWPTADNHQYLFVYACLAVCTAVSLPREQRVAGLALSARWLIGLCMLLAAVWKLANPAYLDGSFFEYTLLIDDRFAPFATWLGDLPAEVLTANRELRTLLVEGHLSGSEVMSVQLTGSARLASIARFLTWWTVGIEAALAVAFLCPNRRGVAIFRNCLLLLFALTTYAVAPIRGFGWMLMLLGLAQCDEHEKGFRWAFLGGLIVIQICTLPWAAVIALLTR